MRTALYFLPLVLGCACNKSEPAPTSSAGGAIKITADDKGYHPSSVSLEKGKPAVLEFTRTTDSTCAREVVFPELNIKKDLPLNTPVRVELPADVAAKSYVFQCGMAMYKGAVVVH